MTLTYHTRVFASAITMIIVLILIMAALWLPPIDRTVKVMDILFVLDITQSMDVEDVDEEGEKISRLERAKQFTRQTLVNLPCGSHAGLAVFTESRSLVLMNPVEVCQNYHDLTQMLAKINGQMAWAQSSEVSKAVFTAIKQAYRIKPEPSIVFLTDGHESPPLHKTLHAKFRGIPGEISGVFIGIGGDDLLPIPKHDAEGELVGVWQVNDVLHQDVYASSRGDFEELNAQKAKTEHLSSQKKAHLVTLATAVGFDYLSSPSKPNELIKTLEQIAKTSDQTISYDWSPWLATMALMLLVSLYFPVRFVGLRKFK